MEGIVYVAVSQDGFIADKDGEVAWLEPFHSADYGYEQFLASIDLLLIGRTTYDQILGFGDWPYPGKDTFILTTRDLTDPPTGVAPWRDTPGTLERHLRKKPGRCWLVGGGQSMEAMHNVGFVHTVELFLMPVTLGAGIPLWPTSDPTTNWTRTTVQQFRNGVQHVRLLPPSC